MLAGYEERREAFLAEGVSIIAAAVDSQEKTLEVAESLQFPVAYGVTRQQADALGAWWDDRREFIQPTEFMLTRKGKVMFSTYSNAPVGRMDPAETLTLIKFLNAQRAK
ncbi:MAG: redoxin domain-containing protein [Pseudomonadales bacterium]|nr:redoxin domain-containing protein [Pseudomonadales bacterium]